MATLNHYNRLKAVLWRGYRDLPPKERHADLDRFQQLAPRLGGPNPPDPVEFDELYQRALPLVRSLVARDLLHGDLDSDESPAAGQRTEGLTAAPAVKVALGASCAPANDTTQDAAPPPGQAKGAHGEGQRAAPTTPSKHRSPSREPTAAEPTKPTTTATVEIPFHAVANIFPLMFQADLKKLAEDITENGLHEAIWQHEGRIIDGRNRYRACLLAGVEPRFREWDGNGSLVTFALSLNLHRRHLTDQQRALVAVRVMHEFEAEAVERSRSNLLQNKGSTEGANLPPRSDGRSADRAAALLQVSASNIKKAAKLLMEGSPELVTAVELDQASLDAAALVATLPVKEQRKIVEQGKVKERAKELRAAKAKPKTKDADENQGGDGSASQERPTEQADDGDAGSSTATTASTTTSGATSDTGEKPTAQAQEDQTSSSASEDTASSTEAQETATSSNPKPTQTAHDTTTETKPPPIKFKDALSVVMRVIAKNGPKLGRGVMTQIGSQEAITYWLRSSNPREDLSALEDHVAHRLEALADKDLEDATAWLKEHVEQLWGIIRERVPRQEGDDRTDNSDYE